ncbi:transcriptional regulator [Amycolatopsis sp. CA-230715]|uniref:transcriptional regulator n=1 Tax=Amycolatopsis sp. CA-230715 TaxID=2745196 RepID=UPI001C039F7C|nr:transcriptional regulator [Amycolatopsis sp. CA-230715]QWF81803.1 hypothetical protein HUW46_05236 [Amycolatopsis sp. CA-230715]
MTGQRTHAGPATGKEVAQLLSTGPFADALRAAIEARGLGLERIRYRLRTQGVSISLATLSHWQSGRCQPDRRTGSMIALSHLEAVLRVPPNSLARLLTTSRGNLPRPVLQRSPGR